MARLREYLAECAKLYLSKDIDDQRLAVAVALFEVSKFLESQSFPPETILPVFRPALALFHREKSNALDPMFARRSRTGRPSKILDQHFRTAMLALFANAWLEIDVAGKHGQRQKLSTLARKLRAGGLGGVTVSQLKAARETVSQEAANAPPVIYAKRFERFFESASEVFGRDRAFSLMIKYVSEHEVRPFLGI